MSQADSNLVGGKLCAYCEIHKPLTEFSPDSRTSFGVSSYCKPCKCAYVKDLLSKRPPAVCHPDRRTVVKRLGLCRPCYAKRHYDTRKAVQHSAAWKAKNPDKVKGYQERYRIRHLEQIREQQKRYRRSAEYRERNLRIRYKISQKDYDAIYQAQDGKCAICHTFKKSLDVDHNHETGEVRGLLCNPCNRTLGIMEQSYNLGATMEAFDEYLKHAKRVPKGVYG